MDNLGGELNKKKVWQLFKQNAPSLFIKYAKKRIASLNMELQRLRQDWQNAKDDDKKKIELYAFEIKDDIRILTELLEKPTAL